MGIFKKPEPTFFETESERIQKELAKLDPNSDEYNKLLQKLVSMQELCGKNIEMHQKLTKEGRGNIIGKVVGFLGLGGLAFGLAKFEKGGNMFSGTSEKSISGLIKIGTRFFG